MAGPLNGVGVQQQVPIANTYQPGQATNDVRQREDVEARENTVQPQGTETAQAQNSETRDQDSGIELRNRGEALAASGSQERGSVLDITV
mgnify:FL=1